MATINRVMVYGGKGALGSTCVQFFKSKNWWVGSIDLCSNEEADSNVILTNTDSWTAQEDEVIKKVELILGDNKLDAIICVAGGWAGGNASHTDFIKNCDAMIKQSLWSSCIAAKVAAKFLNEGGLLTLTGAEPALKPTPGMIGYGLAKAACLHLTKSLGEKESGMPARSTVLAILPVTLDTPMNRKWMPKSDFSTWTSLSFVGNLFYDWASLPDKRPLNGSHVQLITTMGNTELKI